MQQVIVTNAVINYSPANHGGVIAVASVNSHKQRSSFSNYGTQIAVCAPGGDAINQANPQVGILSLQAHTSNYVAMAGTSMAAPHVTAVLALVMQIDQLLDFEKARYFLHLNGDSIDTNQPIGDY